MTIETKFGLLFVGVLYCPPGTDTNLSILVSSIMSLKLYNFLLGDFNVDISTPSTTGCELRSLFSGFGLHQLVWVYDSTCSTLDLALCNDLSIKSCFVCTPLGSSGHCFIPSKLVTCRKSFPPWMNRAVKRAMRLRDKARATTKRLDCPIAWGAFRHLRNVAVSAVCPFSQTLLLLYSRISSPRDFWEIYHSLTGSSSSLPSTLSDGHSDTSCNRGKAEVLNSFFASCFITSNSTTNQPSQLEASPLCAEPGSLGNSRATLDTLTCTGSYGYPAGHLSPCALQSPLALITSFQHFYACVPPLSLAG